MEKLDPRLMVARRMVPPIREHSSSHDRKRKAEEQGLPRLPAHELESQLLESEIRCENEQRKIARLLNDNDCLGANIAHHEQMNRANREHLNESLRHRCRLEKRVQELETELERSQELLATSNAQMSMLNHLSNLSHQDAWNVARCLYLKTSETYHVSQSSAGAPSFWRALSMARCGEEKQWRELRDTVESYYNDDVPIGLLQPSVICFNPEGIEDSFQLEEPNERHCLLVLAITAQFWQYKIVVHQWTACTGVSSTAVGTDVGSSRTIRLVHCFPTHEYPAGRWCALRRASEALIAQGACTAYDDVL